MHNTIVLQVPRKLQSLHAVCIDTRVPTAVRQQRPRGEIVENIHHDRGENNDEQEEEQEEENEEGVF